MISSLEQAWDSGAIVLGACVVAFFLIVWWEGR